MIRFVAVGETRARQNTATNEFRKPRNQNEIFGRVQVEGRFARVANDATRVTTLQRVSEVAEISFTHRSDILEDVVPVQLRLIA